MTHCLFDTMVVSVSFAPSRHPGVAAWLARDDVTGWVSTVSVGEIRRGIVKAEQQQPDLAARLEPWLAAQHNIWAERFLPVSTAVAEEWGRLSVRLGRKDVDLLIAATALVHDLTVATRNTRHFAGTGVRLFNPWTGETFA